MLDTCFRAATEQSRRPAGDRDWQTSIFRWSERTLFLSIDWGNELRFVPMHRHTGGISNRKFPYFRSFHFHWSLSPLERISPNRLSISFVAVLMTILGLIDPYISSPYCGSCSQEGAAIHDFFALFGSSLFSVGSWLSLYSNSC